MKKIGITTFVITIIVTLVLGIVGCLLVTKLPQKTECGIDDKNTPHDKYFKTTSFDLELNGKVSKIEYKYSYAKTGHLYIPYQLYVDVYLDNYFVYSSELDRFNLEDLDKTANLTSSNISVLKGTDYWGKSVDYLAFFVKSFFGTQNAIIISTEMDISADIVPWVGLELSSMTGQSLSVANNDAKAKLYGEFKTDIFEDDSSVFYVNNGKLYYIKEKIENSKNDDCIQEYVLDLEKGNVKLKENATYQCHLSGASH